MNMERLALIDDDLEIRQLLSKYLSQHGYKVVAFADGESFLEVDFNLFGCIILDIGLPGIDGLDVCRHLRKSSSIPIVMLTAASDDLDRIIGLELGADDYIGKPFNPRELLARIRALFRRIEAVNQPQITNLLFSIDPLTRSVSYDGKPLDLTGAEFDLLHVFLKNSGQVLSRDKIGMSLHGRKIQPYDRSIDTAVSRLRIKLGDIIEGETIKSIRGKGYVLIIG